MNEIEYINSIKKMFKLNNEDIGSLIGKSGDTFRKGLNRRSITDFEFKEISENLYLLNKHDTKEKKDLLDDFGKYIRTKILKNKSDILDKILPEDQEKKLLNKIIKDPAYNDLNYKIPIGDSNPVFEESEKDYITNNNGNKYLLLENDKYIIEVPKIPYTAYASFIENFDDEYQIKEEFDTTYFTVDRIGRGKYVSFTSANESMNGGGINDTPGGADILARELQRHHWKSKFHKTDYGWIIVTRTGIMHKDIENTDKPGIIRCLSRNPSPEYSEFEQNLDDVHSIFKVIKRTF